MVDLRWRDIDFGDGTLKVQHGRGGKPRTVPMSPGLVQAILRLPRVGDPVLGFTSTSRACARMRRMAFRALVPYRGIHTLRHSCGTRLARDRGLEAAQHHLGHANLATTQVYAERSDTRSREAGEDWQ